MQQSSSSILVSTRSTFRRAAWTTVAYLLGAVLGLASSSLAVLTAAQHFAHSDSATRITLFAATSSMTQLGLLVTALAGGVVLAAICSARCLDAARAARASAAEKRAAAVSVLSDDFLQGITDRFASAATAHQACSVVLVSIDDFDALLQKHGRNTADAVLDAVARALHGGVRASDVVGRVGYDGFAVVLAVEDSGVALRASDRLHKAIQDIAIPLTNNGTLQLNVSLGVAVRGSDEAMEATFERAHGALQQALRDETGKKVKLAAPTLP